MAKTDDLGDGSALGDLGGGVHLDDLGGGITLGQLSEDAPPSPGTSDIVIMKMSPVGSLAISLS